MMSSLSVTLYAENRRPSSLSRVLLGSGFLTGLMVAASNSGDAVCAGAAAGVAGA
jgi:hypothetical protein